MFKVLVDNRVVENHVGRMTLCFCGYHATRLEHDQDQILQGLHGSGSIPK
jgi:hypothetical protein